MKYTPPTAARSALVPTAPAPISTTLAAEWTFITASTETAASPSNAPITPVSTPSAVAAATSNTPTCTMAANTVIAPTTITAATTIATTTVTPTAAFTWTSTPPPATTLSASTVGRITPGLFPSSTPGDGVQRPGTASTAHTSRLTRSIPAQPSGSPTTSSPPASRLP